MESSEKNVAPGAHAPGRVALVGLAGFLLLSGLDPVRAADIADVVDPVSYTYLNLEGGYVNLDGNDVDLYGIGLEERYLNLTDGYYGRAELGHVAGTNLFNGIGAYVHGWDGDDEDISETAASGNLYYKHGGAEKIGYSLGCGGGEICMITEGRLDRSLVEAGLRFFHQDNSSIDGGGLALGIEPFVAFIGEDTSSEIGAFVPAQVTRSSRLDAAAYGALLALDARHRILDRTFLTARAAAGAYYLDADADTDFSSYPIDLFTTSDSVSSDFFGFRGQLALGIEQMLSDTMGIGVIGRLDYWSDFPSMDWTDQSSLPGIDNAIASSDFLALSIGARLTVNFR